MKSIFTRLTFVSAFLLSLGFSSDLRAQYCFPTFLNGCFSWTNQAIVIDSISWNLGTSDCLVSDYTTMSTTLIPGESVDMSVTSGNWTGCAVWIDLNSDFEFEESENMHYEYVGGDPGYAYNFSFTIPGDTPAGAHRMRVIAGWGSDGFTENIDNGYGPCGNYQYGNFVDFTINVAGEVEGIFDNPGTITNLITAYPNPVSSTLTVNTTSVAGKNGYLFLTDIAGKKVLETRITASQFNLDMNSLENGIYLLTYSDGILEQTIKVVK